MKLPWWKIATAGGIACVAAMGIIELQRPSEPAPAVVEPTVLVVAEGETASPWPPINELGDETAGIDPDAMLPVKLLPVGSASDLEFSAASVPQVKNVATPELDNPTLEELLVHIARNARKRKNYDESAKFYRRIIELRKDRADLQYEFAELLAEAGDQVELKGVVEKFELQSPSKDDAGRNRLAALKEQVGKTSTRSIPTLPGPPPSIKMRAGKDEQASSRKDDQSILKALEEPPKPATAKSPSRSFDSLDPPIIPSPPAIAKDASKKNSTPPELPFAPRPGPGAIVDDAPSAVLSDRDEPLNVERRSEWAPIRSIDPVIRRIEPHPLDEESAFDLGRNYSQLHATREAAKLYERVLSSDPNSYAAAVAAHRLRFEHGTKATLDGDYFRQRGRDGLTDIDRYRLQGWLSLNLGDEDEYIAVGEGWLHDTLRDSPDVDGSVVSVRAQYKPFDLLLLYAQLNGEIYDRGFQNRLTYDVGAAWRTSDRLRVYGSVFANNVAENAESIRQDVHRHGFTGGVDYSLDCCDDFGGFYRFADYSDDNQLNEFGLYASRRLSVWPNELKLIGDVHYWSYDSGTAFVFGLPFGAPASFGVVHPYFAPGGYSLFSGHLEWKKALSSDVFKEADLTWVGLRGGGGVDSDGVPFAFGRAIFHRDFCYWLSFQSELGVTESRVYRDLSAFAYLTARLRRFAR